MKESDPDSLAYLLSRRDLLLFLGGAGLLAATGSPRTAAQETPSADTTGLVQVMLAIIQPASAEEVAAALGEIRARGSKEGLPTGLGPLSPIESSEVELLLVRLEELRPRAVVRVGDDRPERYSLAAAGWARFTPVAQFLINRVRLGLLARPWWRTVLSPRVEWKGARAGVAPVQEPQSIIDMVGLPQVQVGQARPGPGAIRADPISGLVRATRGTALPYLSYASLEEIARAGGLGDDGRITPEGVALCLGLSPDYLYIMARRCRAMTTSRTGAKYQYRLFEIAKHNGGTRTIQAPRRYLKTLQRLFLDFFLVDLPVHDNVHSFRRKNDREKPRSHRTHAAAHLGKRIVVTMDIKDYFGSIRGSQVQRMLIDRAKSAGIAGDLPLGQFDQRALRLLARLCVFQREATDGSNQLHLAVLPQGAPTSPILSNAMLYDFDQAITAAFEEVSGTVEGADLTYTRYADDIAISANRRWVAEYGFLLARRLLLIGNPEDPDWIGRGFHVNGRKTRFTGRGRRQEVTGLVVNDMGFPPRRYRRNIRAAFFNAERNPKARFDRSVHQKLRGYLDYLKSFETAGRDNLKSEILGYQRVLDRLTNPTEIEESSK